jgi:hypothetical protein
MVEHEEWHPFAFASTVVARAVGDEARRQVEATRRSTATSTMTSLEATPVVGSMEANTVSMP